ncbi:MAG: hypothetical protein Aurels2KO_49820 [Aureliella sp.]
MRQDRRTNLADRRAVATLELVLTLPLLLALIVALVWLGYSLVGQTQVTIAARHSAWAERFGKWDGRPFDFNDTSLHESEKSQSVNVTPLLASESGPQSRHAVAKGNWDYRNVEFRAAPNLELMTQVMFAAKTTGVISDYEDLRDALDELQSIGDKALGETLAEIARELTTPSEQIERDGDAAENRAELDRDLDKAKAEGDLRDLRQERDRLEQQLKDAEADSDEADDADESTESSGEDRKWLIEKKLERVEIEIDLAKDRLDAF